jgi:hypothetical protein
MEWTYEHLCLRALPYGAVRPVASDRQHLSNPLREAIGQRPKVEQCHGVASGVFTIVKPSGVDLASQGEPDGDGRLQAWLLIRPWGTGLTRITRL